MEANLLGAEPSAIALDKRAYGNGYPQPAADGPQQGGEETGGIAPWAPPANTSAATTTTAPRAPTIE